MLLGRLGDEERSIIEASFIADEKLFEIVRAAEDELVEQYAFGKLGEADRADFENNYLSLAKGRQRLALTRSLIERSKFAATSVAESKTSIFAGFAALFRRPSAAIASGFAVLALVIGGFWLSNRKPNEVAVQPTTPTPTPATKAPETVVPEPTREVAERPKNPEPKPEPQPTPKPERVAVPMVALIAGSLRDGGTMRQLTITDATRNAVFRLKLDSNDYRAFKAEVVDAEGRSISRSGPMRASGSQVDLSISTASLKTGEYIVKLYVMNTIGEPESVADYPVRIIRK